jgi:predicted RecA/RadA family phage recombinase
MAKGTYWQRGESIDYVNSGDTKIDANTVILYGSRLGIAGADIPAGEKGTLLVEGVYELPKDYGDSGKAITAGQEVQWDNSNSYIKAAVAQVVAEGAVTTEASPVHGYAVAAAASTDKTVLVKINA